MENKVLVQLVVPDIDEKYDIYLPLNKKIGKVIELLNKSINEMSDGEYIGSSTTCLYNRYTGVRYDFNSTIYNTDIRNNTILILM